MQIIKEKISIAELQEMSKKMQYALVKGMVDIEKKVMALDAGMHADLMELLIEEERVNPETTWGFNLFPDKQGDDFIEFDSMMNIKPAIGNMSREVENEEIRQKMREIIMSHVAL